MMLSWFGGVNAIPPALLVTCWLYFFVTFPIIDLASAGRDN